MIIVNVDRYAANHHKFCVTKFLLEIMACYWLETQKFDPWILRHNYITQKKKKTLSCQKIWAGAMRVVYWLSKISGFPSSSYRINIYTKKMVTNAEK